MIASIDDNGLTVGSRLPKGVEVLLSRSDVKGLNNGSMLAEGVIDAFVTSEGVGISV